MRTISRLLCAVCVLAALSLVACGGRDTPPDTGTPTATPTESVTEPVIDSDAESDAGSMTAPVTEPDTDTVTEPGTTPGTESDTEPATATEPATEPDTEPETATDTATEPETAPALPANAIDVTEHGVTAGAGHALENSLALIALLAGDEPVLLFPEGSYEVAFPMYIVGKRQVTLLGRNATLVRTGTVNTAAVQPPLESDAIPAEYRDLTASTAFIVALDTHGLTVEGLTFDYDTPTSLSGKVVSVEGGTAVIELTDGSPVTGGEYATVINTFTADGVPDRVLEQYAETAFGVEKLDDRTVRVSGLAPGGAANLRAGTRVCLRLCTGRDYVIAAYRSDGLTFRDLELCASYNGGILLTERCGDVLLEGVRVQSDNPEALMSLNADALHIADMTGTLSVTDCTFDRQGDDAVNVHSGAYVVTSVEGDTAEMSSPRFGSSPVWALAGDTLAFYDPATFAVVATATVTAVDGEAYTFDSLAGVTAGCVVANTATRPDVSIRDCTVTNVRARGFLLQTDRATVEGCTFRGTALAAILVASDVDSWYEMSPTRELTVRNNTFEGCGYYAAGVVQITASHDDAEKTYPAAIHGKQEITGNTFTDIRTPAVYALCTESLTVSGNSITARRGYRGAYLWVRVCGSLIASDIDSERIDAA